MKNLLNQIIKFGIVGLFCFLIDFGITTGFTNLLGIHYLISKFLGFVVSAVVNYLLSIKFVFTQKKEMDKKKEFTVFLILSAFGLLINEIVMYLCIDGIYARSGRRSSDLPRKYGGAQFDSGYGDCDGLQFHFKKALSGKKIGYG